MDAKAQALFAERLQISNEAIAMKEPFRVPVAPMFSSVAQRLYGSSYRDNYYDFDKAGEAAVRFYKQYPVDLGGGASFTSGKAQEISGINIIDWPGKPGTIISDYSSHQVREIEYIQPEEYRELIDNFDFFIMTKYLPRVFEGLKGLSKLRFATANVLSTGALGALKDPEVLEAFAKIAEIKKYEDEASAKAAYYGAQISDLGIVPSFNGFGEVPFDVISDYFRTTLGAMTDMMEYREEVLELCDLLADRQIQSWKYFEFADMPVKRVFFPLHKGMDGFMSPKQYDEIYLEPYRKMIDYLVSIGVTPVVYTEGHYDTRLEALRDFLPEGKCLVHIETADMKRVKETVGSKNCISGNFPIYLLEFGTPDQVKDYCKYLVDTCAPGGGYIFDTDGSVENAKPENIEAMLDTMYTYGRK